MPKPSLIEFLDLATRHSVVPIFDTVLADRDTAVSAFEKLVGDAPGFLLESVEGGERWAQWSFLGWDPLFTLLGRDGKVTSEMPVPEGDLWRSSRTSSRRTARRTSPGFPRCIRVSSGFSVTTACDTSSASEQSRTTTFNYPR